jgi:hypothetical protein
MSKENAEPESGAVPMASASKWLFNVRANEENGQRPTDRSKKSQTSRRCWANAFEGEKGSRSGEPDLGCNDRLESGRRFGFRILAMWFG